MSDASPYPEIEEYDPAAHAIYEEFALDEAPEPDKMQDALDNHHRVRIYVDSNPTPFEGHLASIDPLVVELTDDKGDTYKINRSKISVGCMDVRVPPPDATTTPPRVLLWIVVVAITLLIWFLFSLVVALPL